MEINKNFDKSFKIIEFWSKILSFCLILENLKFRKEFVKAIGLQRGGGSTELSNALNHLLSTGNVQTKAGLGLMQENGFSMVAERINYLRYVSHFRFFFNFSIIEIEL